MATRGDCLRRSNVGRRQRAFLSTSTFSSLTAAQARKLSATDSLLRFGLGPGMIIGESKRGPIMQIHHSVGIARNQLATGPDSTHSWDFVSPNQDEVLALLKPGSDRRTIVLVASALVAGLGLGLACGATMAKFSSITQTETSSRRVPEIKSSGKSDGARRTASTSGLQTPPAVSAVSPAAAKAEAASPGGPRLSLDPANALPIAREPMVPVPETKPTTIEGWTVLDVRSGTAVLEGPDGIRTAARGDTVPGIGRIDSIVRWGNRWIVATANGLIATP
jgi:hypothetical protein